MLRKTPGFFISFEGTEGSGKSTLIRQLADLLGRNGLKVQVTREPGGSPLAERLRSILLETEMDSRTELYLYEAARAEHVARIIRPALQRGEIVLCDRFTDSTLAYQSYARGLPWKEVLALNRMATGGLEPNRVVFLDLDPKVGLERAQNPNRFEAEGLGFQKKVRLGFLKARKENPEKWISLKPGKHTPTELADQVFSRLKKDLEKRSRRA
ncbi:MAG: dTMP kinase [Bdellovibrio sp.]|nr:dTMP kinase [Bdellovibrio sp.]